MVDMDLDYGISLPNGGSVHASSSKRNRSHYKFFNKENMLVEEFEGSTPTLLTRQSQAGNYLWNCLGNNRNNKRLFSEITIALAQFQEYADLKKEEKEENERIQKKQEYQREIDEALEIYRNIENPLVYLASCIDWITAGERANILISFFTLCSQVVLRHPISLIGVGEGSSGKNHVCETALSMIPSEYIVMEKKPTLASMFRRSEDNPYYYDGKIVNYGDMGGDSDQEDVEETKNILKEMQTDGIVNRPVTVKTKDGFEVVDLCLKGHPCLLYQTVPNYSFDDQELSRSMVMTPRTDNRKIYNEMMHHLELKNGKTYNTHKKFSEKLTGMIPLVVDGLRQYYESIIIVNPYMEVIEDFIGNNPHYKRDLPKLNSILKVITAFNGLNRETHIIDGEKTMFTNREDISLFLTLFDSYREAIATSLTPKATEIINDLRENKDELILGSQEEQSVFDMGISISRYLEKGNVKLSYKSVSRYFSELKDNGYLTIVGKMGNANLYSVVDTDATQKVHFKQLSKKSQQIISNEYDDNILGIVLADDSNDKLSIFEQDSSISIPPWMVME